MEKNETDYQLTFLKKNVPYTRDRAVYIGEENYKRLKRIVKIIGEIPMTDFLENVLNHHFENYWEEINKLLKKKDEEFRKKYM